MTQQELWEFYTSKNPHWLEDGAKLTPQGLRKLFEQTWEVGYKAGHSQAVTAALAEQFGEGLSDLYRKNQ